MDQLSLKDKHTEQAAARDAADVLRRGGVVLYPTDTLYGLGADAFSNEAVDTIYAIKGRDKDKPVHCIVADLTMAEEYAHVDDEARQLAKAFLPGALTLVLKKKPRIETGIARSIRTIGIRIPDHAFCAALAREFGQPFTTTSANKSGEETPNRVSDVVSQLGGTAAWIELAIDQGELPKRKASTVVDLSSGSPVIVREGAIAVADIWEVLRSEY